MKAIFLKEINTFLHSLIAYLSISVFLTLMGLIMWVFPESNVFDYGYADMYVFFDLAPFVFMFLIPAITMRMFSEERKEGTIELLLTQPISELGLILGKYLAGVVLVLFSLIPTLIYVYCLYQLASPVGNIDIPGIIGSYIGLVLLGATFVSIGLLASSLNNNQIVSFLIGAFSCFLLFSGFNSLSGLDEFNPLLISLEELGMIRHYNSLSKGLIDSRDLFYFLAVTSISILATYISLNSRKW